MNAKEKKFVNSIKEKITKYSIKTTTKEMLSLASGKFIETAYNDKTTELVDARIEWELCTKSPLYFISRYGWIPFPGKGVIPYSLYYFQKETLKDTLDFKKLVFLKTRQCLTEDNFVMTDRGYISIKDVKVGDKVETLKDRKSVFVNVLDSFYTGKKEICRILINSGSEINCTLDHKIYTRRGWIEAGNLNLNDEIASNINNGSFGSFKLEKDEHAALIGYYLADGRGSSSSFVNTNKDYIYEVLEIGKGFKNCYPYIYKRNMEEKNRLQGYDVRLVSNTKNKHIERPILDFMKKFGLNVPSKDRILTYDLMNLNKKQMSILLNRLYAGDGWITYNKDSRRTNYISYEIGIGAPNYTLIKQIEYILQTKYGIHGYISKITDKRNPQGMRFWKFRISQKKSVIKFISEIGIKGKTDTEEITNLISKEKPYDHHQSFEKIRKIEYKDGLHDVYDITTESSDFLTNGLLVHNCGISTLFSLYAFWLGNFHESESIDVVSIKQKKAQQFTQKMFPTIDRMPAFLRTPITNKNTFGVTWENGSNIVSESASDKAGRGDSLSLLILDELAFYRSDALTRGIVSAAQPTLTRTGGQQVLVSCLTDDTYIYTNKGIEQISDYKPETCELGYNMIPDFKIDGMKLQQSCNTFYDSGVTPTIKLTTRNGIKIEGSHIHPLMTLDNGRLKFKQLKNITKDDILVIKKGMNSFGTYEEINFKYKKNVHNGKDLTVKKIDESLAYIFGLYLAEGYIYCDNKKHFKLQLAVTENDVRDKIREFAKVYGFHITEQKKKFIISSKGLIKLFERVGFDIKKRSRNKEIPKNLMKMPKHLMKEMLKGMFDGDGCNNKKSFKISYTSFSDKLLRQVQVVLLNFGIFSKVNYDTHNCHISKDREVFLKEIGFNLERKNENVKSKGTYYPLFSCLNNIVNKYSLNKKYLQKKGCDLYIRANRKNKKNVTQKTLTTFIKENEELQEVKEIEYLVSNNLDFDFIKNIEFGTAHTYDFTIPESKTFIANGIVSSNTPNGQAGAGAYYAEQVQQLQIIGGETETDKLITIDWFEVPDLPGIYPKKGYNNVLSDYIKMDYYRNPRIKAEMKKIFTPIAENYKNNPFLKKQHDDLGDILYRQEIEHDFIVSGDQVFNEETLDTIKIQVTEPLEKNKLGRTRINGFYIWKYPVAKKRYLMGVDVASGSGGDFSVIEVMDVETYEQVAEYQGQVATKTFGKIVKKIARYYNEAYTVIECNSIGEAVFNEVYYDEYDPYTNLYKEKKTQNGVIRMTGWITTSKSRQLMINTLIDYFTVDELFQAIKINSQRLYNEMLSFVWVNGKAMHASSSVHDDTLIAFGLCLYFRNKATNAGESFLLDEDGEIIGGLEESNELDDVKLNEEGFDDFVSSDDLEFKDTFGITEEQYSWLLGN